MQKSTFTPGGAALRALLVDLRRRAGLSQPALAKRLGRERSFIARLELGERRLDVVEFHWLCRACGADPKKVAAQAMDAITRAERSGQRARHRVIGARKSRR